MTAATPDREYYRGLRRKSGRFCVNLAAKNWCDLWHQHFDWEGFGDRGWVHRRKHVGVLLGALRRARVELSEHKEPYQLFALIYPHSSAEDAIYVHTPNPNGSPFPIAFDGATLLHTLPPILAGRVDRALYDVYRVPAKDGIYFVVQPQGLEVNPSIHPIANGPAVVVG
jgi:hypothetical protein